MHVSVMVHLEKNFLCQSHYYNIRSKHDYYDAWTLFIFLRIIYLAIIMIYFILFLSTICLLYSKKITTSIYFSATFRLKMFLKKLSMSSRITFSYLMPLSRNVKNVQRLTYVECIYSLNQRNDNVLKFWTQPQHHSRFRLNKWVTKGNVR